MADYGGSRTNDEEKEGVRLDKLLAHWGVDSRRRSKDLIRQGRVKVNERIIKEPGRRVSSQEDILVEVDGSRVSPTRQRMYIKLHKPTGYITTTDDPRGRPTVMELVSEVSERIFPVGRLDRNTSGLLFLTNDGEWSNKVVHPGEGVSKVYLVDVEGRPTQKVLNALLEGISLADRKASLHQLNVLEESAEKCTLKVVLQEGKYRQIRRLFATVGHPVFSLHRLQIGDVKLGELAQGEWTYLQQCEVNSFK